MKKIIQFDTWTAGPFDSVEVLADRYVCDQVDMQFSVVGQGQIVDVPDDFQTPEQIAAQKEAEQKQKEAFNANQKLVRLRAYGQEADPLFFKAQRGEATMQEWEAKVEEIKQRFPYQE